MTAMHIEKIVVRHMNMTMKQPFTTSFGSVQQKRFLIVEVHDEQGNIGYGEGEAFEAPWYTEETTETCAHIIETFLAPLILQDPLHHPNEVTERFRAVRRNNMAKAAVECAIWDVYCKRMKQPLWKELGGSREKIAVGVSIGLQPTKEALYAKIDAALQAGYSRIKVKIKRGYDVELVASIREKYPTVPLMVDANSAYTLEDLPILKQLDAYNLLMIEQPLGADDIINHAKLQSELSTPICLDESIHSYEDVLTAIQLKSCRVMNVKQARVGGLTEARRIHDICVKEGIQIWCGGMLESGIGRAHAVALTSLAGFTLPGDTAGSVNYWHEDLIQPLVVVEEGFVHMQQEPGIGYHVDRDILEKYTESKKTIVHE